MTDEEYARSYWNYADGQEDKLLQQLHRLGLHRRLEAVYDHFGGKPLNERIPTREVVRLHEHIDGWLESGLEVREYNLLLRDARHRRTIQRREELFIWLLAAFCLWYADVLQAAEPVLLHTAQERYRAATEQAREVTGKVYRSRVPQSVGRLMTRENPVWGRTVEQKLFLEAQYHANQLAAQYSAAGLLGKEPTLDTDRIRRIERNVLARSDGGGHHGIIDQQLTFVVGYTVLQALEDAGVKKYRFIAVMDNRTTHACRWLNGRVFDIKDAKLGVNVPPISVDQNGLPIPHPCRSMIRVEE